MGTVIIFMVHVRVYAEKNGFKKNEANGKPRLIYTQPFAIGGMGS